MTDYQNGRAKRLPWPEHVTAAGFKSHSNFFVGSDGSALTKSLLSIRSMVGAGFLLAFFLPKPIVGIVAAALTLPQLILTLARHFRIIDDPFRKAHPVFRGRYCADIEGDFCVFHIGAILNGKVPSEKFKELGDAFNEMVKELEADPEKFGFLGASNYISANQSVDTIMSIQYWRSQEQLNAYARDHLSKHLQGMMWTSRVVRDSAHFGIWHESYSVRAGQYESIYINCPQILLGKAGKLVPAAGHRKTARGRLGVTDGADLDEHNLAK